MQQKTEPFALFFKIGLICLAMTMMTGCQLLPHSLQPKQLRKLNRGPELGRDSYNFSIKDPALPTQGKYFDAENSEAMSRALNDQNNGTSL